MACASYAVRGVVAGDHMVKGLWWLEQVFATSRINRPFIAKEGHMFQS
jgi:hypothetical protein